MKKLLHKLKFLIIIVFVATFSLTLLGPTSYAKEDEESHSLFGDIFIPVFDVELTDGNGLFDTIKTREEREQLNTNIASGIQTQKVSLFDRFGSTLKFVPYYGEKNFSLNIVDHIYTKLIDDEEKFEFKLKDLFWSSDSYFNTEVYYGRPYVLTGEELDNGSTDPRTSQYGSWSTGGSVALGNFYLTLSEFIVDFSTFFISGNLFELVFQMMELIFNSSVWTFIKNMINIILPLLMIFVVIKLTKQAILVSKGDLNNSKEGLIKTIAGVFVSLMIIFTFVNRPGVFNKTINTAVTWFDDAIASSTSDQLDDEVISSSDSTNVMRAMVWKTAILEPWCNGMFQNDYENLYTQFEPDSNKTKMPQSSQQAKEGSKTYNSKDIIGDVKVKLYNGKDVRNWCALAWSTTSKYHINSDGYEMDVSNGWPASLHTANNPQIYVDTFRWLDAKLDISPLYDGTNKINDYANSHPYKETFVKEGMNSLVLALLTLFFIPLAFKRIIQLILIVGMTVSWIFGSLRNLIIPDSYNRSIFGNLKASFGCIKRYAWYSLMMYLLLFIYTAVAGKGFMQNIIYILFAITLNAAQPPTSASIDRLKSYGREILDKGKQKVKDSFSGVETNYNSYQAQKKQLKVNKKKNKELSRGQSGLKK